MPTKSIPSASHRFHFAVGRTFGVDPVAGKLTNLQLMAGDREAKGHGVWIDEATLESAYEACHARGGRLKAYVTHNHGGAVSYEQPEADEAASELNICGFFSDLTVEKGQLVAGTYEFFDAFKRNYAPQFEQIMEMAQKTPDLIGLSIECWGYVVYVGKDGTEYTAEPDDVELLYNGMPALRVTDLWAAAFVADGAATDGLFAKLSRKFAAKLDSLLHPKAAAVATTVPLSVPSVAQSATPPPSDMTLFATLKTRLTDPARLTAALGIVAATPVEQLATLTPEAVEQQLAAQEREAAFTALTAERDTLRTQVTALTTERDTAAANATRLQGELAALQARFDALKKTGHDAAGVNLGAGAGGATADEANPWAKATFNRTRQAEILKADPARAAALKEAAKAAK